ncbi:MAG TPA: hypothetical protein VEV16_12665, partial [Daejeonella sp.]|nr:hypothetical protein [Daejeonella sp.]
YIHQGQGILISDLTAGDKTMTFSIRPAFESKGVIDQKIWGIGDDLSGNSIKISSGFMQFGNFKVLRWTKDFDGFIFDKQVQVDALLLSGNPRINVKTLTEYVRFSVLLIDATNPDYRIEQWQKEAQEFGLAVRVLKKNPAHVIKL